MLAFFLASALAAEDPLVTMPELLGARLRQEIGVAPQAGATCDGAAATSASVPRGDVPVLVVDGDARWRVDGASGTSAGGRAALPAELAVGRHRVCVERDGAAAAVDLDVTATPYTQVALHELAADGTERVRSIAMEVVEGQAVVSRKWMNSDFLHMDRFYDGDGHELRVNVSHADNRYHYDATLAAPAQPGDVLVLDSWGKAEPYAIAQAAPGELVYATTHHPNAGQPTRRLDVFRLPEGATVLDAGGLQQRERAGRTELVHFTTIPKDGALSTRFRYHLDGAPVAIGPTVVSTSPARGATDVDPATKEIRVVFSEDMADGAWSWVQVDDHYPKVKGKPTFADARTCVLPVKLEPDTDYVVWVNHARYHSFHSAAGAPAVPYELRFHTAKR